MITVILDTNFLLYVARFKIDVEAELSRILNEQFMIAILDKTFDELKGKKDEHLAVQLAKKFSVLRAGSGEVDDILAEEKDAIIATQDKELKERLKQKGLKIVVIRQKNHLMLE